MNQREGVREQRFAEKLFRVTGGQMAAFLVQPRAFFQRVRSSSGLANKRTASSREGKPSCDSSMPRRRAISSSSSASSGVLGVTQNRVGFAPIEGVQIENHTDDRLATFARFLTRRNDERAIGRAIQIDEIIGRLFIMRLPNVQALGQRRASAALRRVRGRCGWPCRGRATARSVKDLVGAPADPAIRL